MKRIDKPHSAGRGMLKTHQRSWSPHCHRQWVYCSAANTSSSADSSKPTFCRSQRCCL